MHQDDTIRDLSISNKTILFFGDYLWKDLNHSISQKLHDDFVDGIT